jgi:hypothetical protein
MDRFPNAVNEWQIFFLRFFVAVAGVLSDYAEDKKD